MSFSVALALHKVTGAIKEDTECSQRFYQAWYLDDTILANLQFVDPCPIYTLLKKGCYRNTLWGVRTPV